ncbi:uncharacterized protein LOC127246014 isoform X2 [Andrographis paniculata]|uniref:uncharacterized protein LOC127246014 isoform X2 n=1 Tax=Andrographis paniculata TaxID=175694 RepID=UPI0021E701BE|nr:uncharacterized protein LOC127246014 isoform X2 [Andrographis paniculata]
MEDSAAKDQASAATAGRSASRLLRYPLRSAARAKEEKPPLADSANSNSTAKRGRIASSSVSKSVGVLDVSSKEKPSKPPRRLSVPSKSNASPAPKFIGNITPISETRATRSSAKNDTPLSDVSKSSHRKKYSILSSASYWLSQIRLSESAAKHSISLGFFKLALEARCEPLQRMSDELKSYVRRHSLVEFSEFVKELLESYKINENFEQLQVSEGNQLSDNDDANSSSSSITEAEKPKLKTKTLEKSVANSVKASDGSEKKNRRSVPQNSAISKPNSETTRGRSIQRKSRKDKDNSIKVKQGKKSSAQAPINSLPNEALQENKENMEDEAAAAAEMEMNNNNNTAVEV